MLFLVMTSNIFSQGYIQLKTLKLGRKDNIILDMLCLYDGKTIYRVKYLDNLKLAFLSVSQFL